MRIILVKAAGAPGADNLRTLGAALPRVEALAAESPEEFLRVLESPRCDLAVVEGSLAWADPLEAGRDLRARFPDCPLLMLSRDERTEAVVRAMRAGFDEYLPAGAAANGRLAAAARSLIEAGRGRKREIGSESRLSELLARLNVGAYRATTGGVMLFANAAFCRIFGIESWRDAPAWCLRTYAADPAEADGLSRELDGSGRLQSVELKLRLAGGRERWISLTQCLRPAGATVGIIEGLVEDITERKTKVLAARRREEEDLQHRRLEMIGRLAGGVAHDFNNLLTAINGFSELVLGQMPEEHPLRGCVAEIRTAGSRAAYLTRQLLAFSCRLMLHPRRLDLGAFLACLERDLPGTLGPAIGLRILHDPHLPPVLADPSQLESVVVCLAANAREAMEGGGTLTLRTSRARVAEEGDPDDLGGRLRERLRPGEYGVLCVEDTGKGMDRETLGRIFEPYFTTKPGLPGKVPPGNGLGLSIAYGVLKQSGGAIHVDSEPGRGTRVRLYLPFCAREAAETGTQENAPPPSLESSGPLLYSG